MAKKRFKNIKQRKKEQSTQNTPPPSHTFSYANKRTKLKAFLTDSFMLMMPIMYIVIYVVMGSREGFASHMALGWMYIFITLIIVQTLFIAKSAQTPGYRAYNLKVIDENTGEKPSIGIILFRNFSAVLSVLTLFGWMIMFFRKDAKTLHDLLTRTAIIHTHDTNY